MKRRVILFGALLIAFLVLNTSSTGRPLQEKTNFDIMEFKQNEIKKQIIEIQLNRWSAESNMETTCIMLLVEIIIAFFLIVVPLLVDSAPPIVKSILLFILNIMAH